MCSLRYCLKFYFSKGVYSFTLNTVCICWVGAAPIVFQHLIHEASLLICPEFWSQSGALGLKASSRRWLCRPSFSLDSLQLEHPDAYAPGLLRAGLLWGRVVYTATHGARLSSVPSGDWSANPATDGASGHSSLQRMILSVSSTRKRSRAERLATPSGGL